MGTCILWHLFKSEIFFAFNKEFLHNAVAIENFGLFIDTNLAPEKFFRGKITQGEWHNFRRPCALFIWVEFHVLPCILVCFLVEFDLCFAFGIVSCQILDSASLFILYVHEHDRLGFGMLTVETAVFDCICWFSSSCDRSGQSYLVEYYVELVEEYFEGKINC